MNKALTQIAVTVVAIGLVAIWVNSMKGPPPKPSTPTALSVGESAAPVAPAASSAGPEFDDKLIIKAANDALYSLKLDPMARSMKTDVRPGSYDLTIKYDGELSPENDERALLQKFIDNLMKAGADPFKHASIHVCAFDVSMKTPTGRDAAKSLGCVGYNRDSEEVTADMDVLPNDRQQRCNLLVGVASSVPTWRDNGVPIGLAFSNVDSALRESHTPYGDWADWHVVVTKAYTSKVTSNELERDLRSRCH